MRTRRLLALALALCTQAAAAQVLTEWVETDLANDPYKLALGYPVPIPVNTPTPFAGFRSYAGLHARHQDLAATTPWVHPEMIGTTRQGRTIWAYRLGDGDFETIYGLPEPATLTNGGIHAREWQTPEVVTGILELIATFEGDNHFYDYLRDNVNMIVIPSLNIDGFLQTQRFPSTNYLETDISNPSGSPRDGRMRRKNMLGVDEVLNTTGDHLFGVDLNRNNSPYWATSGSSSSDNRSLVYHGSSAISEPETQALDAAAALGPADQLRVYTDVHSFSQVLLWSKNNNARQAAITAGMLNFFNQHHRRFPAGKIYPFHQSTNVGTNVGIGATDEHFYQVYQVPSFTLEVEPSQPIAFGLSHPELPGWGADYGGVVENGHDGFILPESEVPRVRTELAQTFAAVYYRQAGPPNIQAMRFVDDATGAVVFEAEWDITGPQQRTLHHQQIQPLQLGRDYTQWVAYSKPMRWRAGGEVVPFQGLSEGFLSVLGGTDVASQTLTTSVTSTTWLDQAGGAPDGYMHYEDDAVAIRFQYPLDATNLGAVSGTTDATIRNTAWDITGILVDADPSTIAHWANGNWVNYENTQGADSDFGGEDATISVQVTDEALGAPFVLEPGIAAAWGDPERVGEGFIIEMLENGLAVMFWFTNDDDGGQDWYIGVGEVRGNRLLFPRLLRVSGGVFGDDFDPNAVTEEVVGSAKFLWSGCDTGTMDWRIGTRTGRQNLVRLTSLMGMPCGTPPPLPPISEYAVWSGSWGDPTHDGEGWTVEILPDGSALAFWFSFGPDGHRRWYFGIGDFVDGKLVFDNMLSTTGGVFGEDFDPDDVTEFHWGTLELALDCDGGTATYVPVEAGFEAGQQNVQKITNMDGPACAP
ncbi:MAG: hypothetical protein HKN58_02040 [Xanthomonadales bacterium]|nr:hypothetical protein [Xanthomonadales bacterium]